MKIGDRVRYVGESSPNLIGCTGIVEYTTNNSKWAEVCFDGTPSAKLAVKKTNLELLTLQPVKVTIIQKPHIKAMPSHPRHDVWAVEVYYLDENGHCNYGMLGATIPANSYEHAHAIAKAINDDGLGT